MRIFSIILADDEPNILYGMQKGIDWESLGFSVVGTAQNGKEVLDMMAEFHPDLVISDIKMPFMDGLELAKNIHENYMNTKVILFSGWDDFTYARLAISYGVSEYVMKPIDYEEMQHLLIKMYQELEKEYNEKINRVRLENAYTQSLPLLRQQFFSRLMTEVMEEKSEAGSFGSGVLSYSSKSGKRREEGHSQRTVNEGNVEGSTGKNCTRS